MLHIRGRPNRFSSSRRRRDFDRISKTYTFRARETNYESSNAVRMDNEIVRMVRLQRRERAYIMADYYCSNGFFFVF